MKTLIFLCFLSLFCSQAIADSSDGEEELLNMLTIGFNMTRGIIYSFYTEMGEIKGAVCIKKAPEYFYSLYYMVLEDVETPGWEISWRAVIKYMKELTSIFITLTDDCADLYTGILKLDNYIDKMSNNPQEYWTQFLKNAIAESLALGTQMQAIFISIQQNHFFQVGAEIGDILYDLILLRMNDF